MDIACASRKILGLNQVTLDRILRLLGVLNVQVDVGVTCMCYHAQSYVSKLFRATLIKIVYIMRDILPDNSMGDDSNYCSSYTDCQTSSSEKVCPYTWKINSSRFGARGLDLNHHLLK